MKKSHAIFTGLVAGLLNGLLGAGGGMIVVPMLEKDGLPVQKAHATSLCVIAPLSLISAFLYLRGGHLSLQSLTPFLLPGLIGAALGGYLLPRVRALWLHRIFGVLVLAAALRLLFT